MLDAPNGVMPREVLLLRGRLAARWSRVRDVFHSWDEDGNGTVSRAEWCRALPAMGLGDVSYADTAALFDFRLLCCCLHLFRPCCCRR